MANPVTPNTTVIILQNIPLEADYRNTVKFASATAQYTAMYAKRKYVENSLTYQRTTRGTLRVQHTADELFDCNYLMFQNTSYGNKWFYAFITSVDYINDITCEISYKIDVMQTFMFEYTVGRVFVEREHSESDVIGENTVPENLPIGDAVSVNTNDQVIEADTQGHYVVFLTTFDVDGEPATPDVTNDVFSSVQYHVFDVDDDDELEAAIEFANMINQSGELQQGVVAIFMSAFGDTFKTGTNYTFVDDVTKNYTHLAGNFYPKNNKLFTFPYNYLLIMSDTETKVLNYEYFSGNSCTFALYGTIAPTPTQVLIPSNYLGSTINFDKRMTITNFPQCAITLDVYAAYLAQHGGSDAVRLIGGAGNLIVDSVDLIGGGALKMAGKALSAITGADNKDSNMGLSGAIKNVISDAENIGTLIADHVQLSKLADTITGTQTSLSDYAIGAKVFRARKMSVKPEFAAIIDDYFTMYGYATLKVKVPAVYGQHPRPHFNYLKTKNCFISNSSFPVMYEQEICSIYDKGITFWDTFANVGNYALSNTPQ